MDAERLADGNTAVLPGAYGRRRTLSVLEIVSHSIARAWADPYRRWAVAVSILAVVLRMVWVLYADVSPTDGRFDDTAWYHFAGHSIALGKGYINPFLGGPTAMWPVGYPAVLGALYFFVGPSVLAAKLLNVVLAALTCLTIYEIGARVFDRRTGLGAALILAFFPSQVLFTSLVMSELLSSALLALVVLLLLAGDAGPAGMRLPALIAVGVLSGAATLVRGEMGLFPLVVLAYWGLTSGSWRRALRYSAIVAVGSLVFIGPWFVRNLVVLNAPVVVSSSLGGNFWIGNHADASGHFEVNDELERIGQEYVYLPPAEYEIKMNNRLLREGLSYAVTHPVDELRLAKDKLAAIYSNDDSAVLWNDGYLTSSFLGSGLRGALKGVSNDYFYAVLAAAVLGAIVWARRWRSPGLLIVLAILYWTAIHVAFFGDQRFHYAVVPLLNLLAALPASTAIGWWSEQRRSSFVGSVRMAKGV